MDVPGRQQMPVCQMTDLRNEFHAQVRDRILDHRETDLADGFARNPTDTRLDIASRLAAKLGWAAPAVPKWIDHDASDPILIECTAEYIRAALSRLLHLRPGVWNVSAVTGAVSVQLDEPYKYVADVARALSANCSLLAAPGGDYLITPDIIVSRRTLNDYEINIGQAPPIVDADGPPKLTPLRRRNRSSPRDILHASISCKWTIRSDRSQNSRTEALNLIRNRKGRTPHICVVVFEPLPTRIASIAMGTGDIDATYHGALHELVEAVREGHYEDQLDMLETLINGRRLRDISDLPFDLAI